MIETTSDTSLKTDPAQKADLSKLEFTFREDIYYTRVYISRIEAKLGETRMVLKNEISEVKTGVEKLRKELLVKIPLIILAALTIYTIAAVMLTRL